MRLSFALALACCLPARAQTPQDPPILFRERVNLVTVPVVVRDARGRSVGSLRQDDFQILDRGKPQTIGRFSVETRSKAGAKSGGSAPTAAAAAAATAPPAAPERYVAYLFDDMHLEFADLARARDAAWAHMRDSLAGGDRAAIYTTSAQTIAEFTDDRDKLHATLLKLMPRGALHRSGYECPDMGHYQADLIINRNDPTAFRVAVAETIVCAQLGVRQMQVAEAMARAAATRVVAQGNQQTRAALSTLREVVKRMAAAPGQRVIVLASSGFVATEEGMTRNEIIDRAIKANVTINGLDARGLYVDNMFDASGQFFDTGNMQKSQIERHAQRASSDIVADLAHGTGGKFFENSNDLGDGFRRLADPAEHVYVLGFSPKDLKLDGSYHSLKVTVRGEEKLTASARRGYYAPKQLASPEEAAKEELQQALFSRDEQREIPVDVEAAATQSEDGKPQLAVTTRVHLKTLRFREQEGRHEGSVLVVNAIFDRNGNCIKTEESKVDLKLLPATMAASDPVMQVRKTFPIAPGAYTIRVVVRESEDRHLTALNAGATIP